MVFFTCGACGEQIKKPQVEKHYLQKCRRCEVLTCIDCLKDFYGDEYKTHNQCMSEAQRYSKEGRNGWDPNVGQGNKGELKQQAWIGKLRELLNSSTDIDRDVMNICDVILNHENIPRKRPKFINFVKNIMRQKANHSNIEKTWELFSQALATPAPKQQNGGDTDSSTQKQDSTSLIETDTIPEKKKKQKNREDDDQPSMEVNSTHDVSEDQDKKKKKKKKKEKDNGEAAPVVEEDIVTNGKDKKKKKKKGASEENGEAAHAANGADEQPEKKLSKKELKRLKKAEKKNRLNGNAEAEEDKENEAKSAVEAGTKRKRSLDTSEDAGEEEPYSKKTKFDWDETITAILKQKPEMKVNKLKKKCVSEYFAQHPGTHKSQEEIGAKFDKKLKKKSYKVIKDKVSLATSRESGQDEPAAQDLPPPSQPMEISAPAKEESKMSFNKWESVSFGGNDHQMQKFRRLMGMKSSAPPPQAVAAEKRDDQKIFNDLEKNFERARQSQFQNKGKGLGFSQ